MTDVSAEAMRAAAALHPTGDDTFVASVARIIDREALAPLRAEIAELKEHKGAWVNMTRELENQNADLTRQRDALREACRAAKADISNMNIYTAPKAHIDPATLCTSMDLIDAALSLCPDGKGVGSEHC